MSRCNPNWFGIFAIGFGAGSVASSSAGKPRRIKLANRVLRRRNDGHRAFLRCAAPIRMNFTMSIFHKALDRAREQLPGRNVGQDLLQSHIGKYRPPIAFDILFIHTAIYPVHDAASRLLATGRHRNAGAMAPLRRS